MICGSLRKRWVLSAIFITSVIYFLYNTAQLPGGRIGHSIHLLQKSNTYENAETILRKLKWHGQAKPPFNKSKFIENLKNGNCRNSLQGVNIITDEEGFVCKRQDAKKSGCCDIGGLSTSRYVCSTCLSSNCCSVYEHCVSCCMKPDKRGLLEKIIRENVNNLQQLVFSNVNDQFDLCLTKCRTSSNSVQHENSYRDAQFKYCFGRSVPEIQV